MKIEWIDGGRSPQCAADPRYPSGIDVDIAGSAVQTCETTLPYPAERCGAYSVRCETCGMTALVTTAGRPDDPRRVKVACKPH